MLMTKQQSPRFMQTSKHKEIEFVGFIIKINISRYENPILVFFMSKSSQRSVVLEYSFNLKNAILHYL